MGNIKVEINPYLTKVRILVNYHNLSVNQLQSDWNQDNISKIDFIKNKPTRTSDFINDGEGTDPFIKNSDVFFTEDIPVILSLGKSAGAFVNGDIVKIAPKKTIKELIYMILQEVVNPTFEEPSLDLSCNDCSELETGTSMLLTLTALFNRGIIFGNMVGGVWDENAFQNYRAGTALSYLIDGTTVLPPNNTKILANYKVVQGANTFNASVTYAEGSKPLDSSGNEYADGLPSGTISTSLTFLGSLRRFYGAKDGVFEPRDLSNTPFDTSAPTFDLLTGTTASPFHLYIPFNKKLDKVLSVEASNADITSQYIRQSDIAVNDIGGDPHTYKYYVMETDQPYSLPNTHRITIKND